MPFFIGKTFLIVTIFCIALTTVACGARDSDQDIAPVGTIEPQTVPEASATPEPVPTLTDLPVEITEPISPISPVSPGQEPAMSPINSDIQPIPGSEDALAAAIADLSEQTGLPAGDIRLVSMEAVQWSDASLGCPQEGFMYAQVVTPGYLIVLEAQGQQYEYHTDQATNVVLCEA